MYNPVYSICTQQVIHVIASDLRKDNLKYIFIIPHQGWQVCINGGKLTEAKVLCVRNLANMVAVNSAVYSDGNLLRPQACWSVNSKEGEKI